MECSEEVPVVDFEHFMYIFTGKPSFFITTSQTRVFDRHGLLRLPQAIRAEEYIRPIGVVHHGEYVVPIGPIHHCASRTSSTDSKFIPIEGGGYIDYADVRPALSGDFFPGCLNLNPGLRVELEPP
jgi:hypothetical protein